jgi:hypothetical protein
MVDTVIITRHEALKDMLIQDGYVPADTPVISHATPEDLKGKHVYEVLPLHLASEAETVTEVPMKLREDQRGRELSLEETREAAGQPVTYRVSKV